MNIMQLTNKSTHNEYYYGKLPTLESFPKKTIKDHGTNKDQ